MCVAFVSNSCSDSNRIQPQGFSDWMGIYNISDSTQFTGGNPWTSRLPAVKEEDDSSSSSSIGKNSDAGGGDSDDEVQSKDNGPLNQLNDLEKVLPIKLVSVIVCHLDMHVRFQLFLHLFGGGYRRSMPENQNHMET
ncbi:unnamed protein product [Lactuca virosa]|uniref:Uncharacterized protein n=1 Tax=Lactuca virosa TaxID=75947 RepID=A0AAU9N2J3_9ASTR|nr:unnamed protein product [Lactuca virosa]